MSVTRYRSIEEMPRPWRKVDDPENLRIVARMLELYRRLHGGAPRQPGVTRFRSVEEARAARDETGKAQK